MLRTVRFATAYFAAWIPVWAAYFALIYFQGSGRNVGGALSASLFGILTASLMGLGVWRVAARLASRPATGGRIALTHVGLSLAYTAVWTGLNTAGILVSAPDQWPYFRDQVIGWHAFNGLLLYGIVAGVAHFVESNRRVRREREAAERADAMRARAELAALRSQLNPHFLFNTLHSISALVHRDPDAAEAAIEGLADLLRRVLQLAGSEADSISLAEEWSIIERQLDLERLRFGDRLAVVAQFDDDALDSGIPVLTLQPIVENAVRHGISPREEGGTIRIAASVHGERMRIIVENDGAGAPAAATAGTGNGLRLVRQRLAAVYGAAATLRYEQPNPVTTRVTIELPARPAPPRRPLVTDREVVSVS